MMWSCEGCGTIYAEYVNGCPKCWDSKQLHFSVTFTALPQLENLSPQHDGGSSPK